MSKIIYKVTNLITQEVYIGQTTNTLHNRKTDHIYEAFNRKRTDKFHSALREFGLNNFIWEEVEKSNNFTNLAKKERELILKYDSINGGYNTNYYTWKAKK